VAGCAGVLPSRNAASVVAIDEVRRWVALLATTATIVGKERRAAAERQSRAEAQAALISRVLDETIVRHDAMWTRLRAVEADLATLRLRETQSRLAVTSLEDVATSQRQIVGRERSRSIEPAEDTPPRRTALSIVDEGTDEARQLLDGSGLAELGTRLAHVDQRLQSARDLLAETKRDIESLRLLADEMGQRAKHSRDRSERFALLSTDVTTHIAHGEASASVLFSRIDVDTFERRAEG
jgi:hypothetical protein